MTPFTTSKRPQNPYRGTAETLAIELKMLPPNTVEWRRRIGRLVDQLKAHRPCHNAMRTETRRTDKSVEIRHCIEGVITATAEEDGAIEGEWVISDYCPDPAEFAPQMLPRPVTNGGTRLGPPDDDARCEVTEYEYYVQRDAARTEEKHRRHNPFSPAQARLWFGLDTEPNDGSSSPINLSRLSQPLRRSIDETRRPEIPDFATFPELNGLLFEQSINPLHFAAHMLKQSTTIPVTGLWHPHIMLMMRQEGLAAP